MRSPLVIASVEQYIKGARFPLDLIFRAPKWPTNQPQK
jgi:hypothetical protein